jgi:hypothetical protein
MDGVIDTYGRLASDSGHPAGQGGQAAYTAAQAGVWVREISELGEFADVYDLFHTIWRPGFTLPGDTSASGRHYKTDITAPFILDNGHLHVPASPGIGAEPLLDALTEATTSPEWLRL